jgi:cell division cycle 20-like protein 1 (cofactor of APC complex)
MLASGGNDNKLMVWQVGHNAPSEPLARFGQHCAAVKAINWSPLHRGLLATGGGTADQHIRFWNTLTLQPLSAINTGSQVCNLVFSKTNDELVSTHGYSLNQVIVWKYPTMEKIATLTGHTYRVLYLAMSPDGSSIVTGAGDETLRFWNIFPKSRSNRGAVGNNEIVGSGTSALFPSSIDFR